MTLHCGYDKLSRLHKALQEINLSNIFRFKGIYISLPLLVVAGLLVWQFGLFDEVGQAGNDLQPSLSSHQTGKAFEVIETSVTPNAYSGKTAEELMREADQLVATTNQLIATQGLKEPAITSEQQKEVDEAVKQLQQQLAELEQQLQANK
ncbi:MAG: hypothetical protein GY820_48180 [Gammaproteobacteria bacterium]|nr:hypothetical protein [Gammaproteobacteria bacterium]